MFSKAACLMCLRTLHQHKTVTIKLVILHLNMHTAAETLSSLNKLMCHMSKNEVLFQIHWGKARIPVWSVYTAQRLNTVRVPKQTALYFSSLWLFLSSGMWKRTFCLTSRSHKSQIKIFIPNICLMTFYYCGLNKTITVTRS